jgi:hypothetical protein
MLVNSFFIIIMEVMYDKLLSNPTNPIHIMQAQAELVVKSNWQIVIFQLTWNYISLF